MARIRLPEGIPGISGQWPSGLKLQSRCTPGGALLRGPNPLTLAEREMIAAEVFRKQSLFLPGRPWRRGTASSGRK